MVTSVPFFTRFPAWGVCARTVPSGLAPFSCWTTLTCSPALEMSERAWASVWPTRSGTATKPLDTTMLTRVFFSTAVPWTGF